MKELTGINLEKFPLSDLRKVYDLMEYDGPLLSHMTDDKGHEFLYYWVDNDSISNKWIVWEVDMKVLFSYLKAQVDLAEVFAGAALYYSVEISSTLAYNNVKILKYEEVPSDYIPETGLFHFEPIPQLYLDKLSAISSNIYISNLRDSGCNFSLNSTYYGGAVDAAEGGAFLTAISTSLTAYAINDYFEKNKDKIIDISHFNRKVVPLLRESCKPIIVDNKFGSFEVVLNIDTMRRVEESPEIAKWKKKLISNYYQDVFDLDYNSRSDLDLLVEKFPNGKVRRAVIKPLADFLKNSDSKLLSRQGSNFKARRHDRLNKKSYDLLGLRESSEGVEEVDTTSFVNIIMEVNVENGKPKINKKAIDNGPLFQELLNSVNVSYETISHSGFQIKFKKPILCRLSKVDNDSSMSCEAFNIEVHARTSVEAKHKFDRAISELIIRMQDSYNQEDRALFNEYVDFVRPTI